jgi:Ca2+-binding RTX toxin-like protein
MKPQQTIEHLELRRLLAGTPLASGLSVTSTIGVSGETDTYSVTVPSGVSRFVVTVGATSGGGFAPSLGSTLSSTSVSGGPKVYSVPGAGTYDVTVSAGSATGGYRITAFVPGVAQQDDDAGEFVDTRDSEDVNSGQRYAATIEPGDLDLFRIDVTANQRISVTLTENDAGSAIDPVLILLDDDGNLANDPTSFQQTDEEGVRVSADGTQSGRYWAIVAEAGSNDTGIYGIATARVPGTQYTGDPDTAPVDAGELRNGELPAGDVDVFEMPGIRRNDTVTITLNRTGGSLDPDLVVYFPDGSELTRGTRSNNNATSTITFNAATTGTHFVVARDFEADDGGTFDFRYTITSPPKRVINGTDGDDRILVTFVDDQSLTISVNGAETGYDFSEFSALDILAGDGDDYINVQSLDYGVYVSAGGGEDSVYGGSGNDSLTGGSGRNRLFGGDGDDRLNGSNGRDFLYGEAGDDRLYGQAGNDYLDGGGNKDRLFGGDGDDEMFGGTANDQLYANAGNDTLTGGRGDDNLDGGSGTDLVRQQEAGDVLISIEST